MNKWMQPVAASICSSRLLFFLFFCLGGRLGLLFHQQRGVLLTVAKAAAPRQKLCVSCRFTAGIAASNMCFNGLHIVITSLGCIAWAAYPRYLLQCDRTYAFPYHTTNDGVGTESRPRSS